VTAGLVHVPGDAAHRDRRGDDHIGELVKQVITSTVNPLPAVPSMHADERIGHLADLLGQLQQPHLGRDIPVMGIQLANLIPHGLPPVLDADPADSPRSVMPKLRGSGTRRRGLPSRPPCFHGSPRISPAQLAG
jgi:hypothetical protein